MRLLVFIAALLIASSAQAQTPPYAQNFGNTCPGTSALCQPVPLAPKIYYNFLTGPLTSDVILTRNSTGWYFNSSGNLTAAANNVARFDYDPGTLAAKGLLLETNSTNGIRNSTMVGAVTGTPGTLPTNWSSVIGGGLTQEISGTGTENGLNYIDWHISGTANADGTAIIYFDTATGVSAGSFQFGVDSVFVKLSAGSLTNINSTALQFTANNSSGTVLATYTSSGITPTGSALGSQRFSLTAQLTTSNTAFVQPQLIVSFSNGAVIDVTYRIGLPQMEAAFNNGRLTSPIPTSKGAVSRAADIASINSVPVWFNPTFGSFVVTTILPSLALSQARQPVSFSDGTGNNVYSITSNFPTTGGNFASLIVSGSTFSSGNALSFTATNPVKMGVSYQATNNLFSINGSVASAGTFGASALPSGINTLSLTSGLSVEWLQGLSYWDYPLTSSQLQGQTR